MAKAHARDDTQGEEERRKPDPSDPNAHPRLSGQAKGTFAFGCLEQRLHVVLARLVGGEGLRYGELDPPVAAFRKVGYFGDRGVIRHLVKLAILEKINHSQGVLASDVGWKLGNEGPRLKPRTWLVGTGRNGGINARHKSVFVVDRRS